MYANITLETIALDTPNMAVLVADAPAKHANNLSSFQNRTSLPFLILSHRLSLHTITNALQSVNKWKTHSVLLTEVLSM
jgi:hypothetical protein